MTKLLLTLFINAFSNFWRTIVAFIMLILLWLLVSESNILNRVYLAHPLEVLIRISKIPSSTSDCDAIYETISRIGLASLITITVGTCIGLLLGYFSKIYSFFRGILDIFRSVPPVVVLPIFLFMWSGSNSPSEGWRVALSCFGTIPIIIFQIADVVESIPPERRDFARLLGASPTFIIKHILFHEILPFIFNTARVAISFSVIIVVVSEMVLSPKNGIGAIISSAQTSYETQTVYAFAILIGIVGYLLNQILYLPEKITSKWRK